MALANTSRSITDATVEMSHADKYLYDLTGFLIVRNVLSPEQLRLANAAIDSLDLEPSPSYAGDSGALKGGGTSTRLGNSEDLMGLPQPFCQPFREMLRHPAVAPALNTILGEGWRLDHGPGLIAMDTGCEGGMLHGNFDNAPSFYREGKIFTGLTVVEFLLADEGPGDGGVALIPGSHKANLSCPPEMSRWEQYQDFVLEVNAKAGDAIIFSEACTHGTLPWNGAHQRRAVLYKFNASHMAWGGVGKPPAESKPYYDELTLAQKATLEPPSHHSRASKESTGFEALKQQLAAKGGAKL